MKLKTWDYSDRFTQWIRSNSMFLRKRNIQWIVCRNCTNCQSQCSLNEWAWSWLCGCFGTVLRQYLFSKAKKWVFFTFYSGFRLNLWLNYEWFEIPDNVSLIAFNFSLKTWLSWAKAGDLVLSIVVVPYVNHSRCTLSVVCDSKITVHLKTLRRN